MRYLAPQDCALYTFWLGGVFQFSGFFSNQLQLLISPCLPVPRTTTATLVLEHFCSFHLYDSQGTINSPLMAGRRYERFHLPCFLRTMLFKTFQWHIILSLPVPGVSAGSGSQHLQTVVWWLSSPFGGQGTSPRTVRVWLLFGCSGSTCTRMPPAWASVSWYLGSMATSQTEPPCWFVLPSGMSIVVSRFVLSMPLAVLESPTTIIHRLKCCSPFLNTWQETGTASDCGFLPFYQYKV